MFNFKTIGMLPSIFSKEASQQIIVRLNALTPTTAPTWGKMSVAQMLAHCNVTYEMVYDDIHKRPNALVRFILKLVLKNKVVSEQPYPQNGGTAPQFIIKDTKDFEVEKARLIAFIAKTAELGGDHFNQKESHSFGKLSTVEWSNLFFKHLDHHLRQFGV